MSSKFRSARTGRYVSKEHAATHEDTTVRETDDTTPERRRAEEETRAIQGFDSRDEADGDG